MIPFLPLTRVSQKQWPYIMFALGILGIFGSDFFLKGNFKDIHSTNGKWRRLEEGLEGLTPLYCGRIKRKNRRISVKEAEEFKHLYEK